MTRRHLSVLLILVAAVCSVALGSVTLVTDSSPASAADTSSESLPGTDGGTIDLQGIDHADLHADLDSLADAWAVGGGAQGYPFWEAAWRQWRVGAMAGSTFQAYVASYDSSLRRGSDRIDKLDLATDPARKVRVELQRSLADRRAALDELNTYLTAVLEQREDINGETFEVVRQRINDRIDMSYREARLAMNSSQALLDQASQRRIPEDAFI